MSFELIVYCQRMVRAAEVEALFVSLQPAFRLLAHGTDEMLGQQGGFAPVRLEKRGWIVETGCEVDLEPWSSAAGETQTPRRMHESRRAFRNVIARAAVRYTFTCDAADDSEVAAQWALASAVAAIAGGCIEDVQEGVICDDAQAWSRASFAFREVGFQVEHLDDPEIGWLPDRYTSGWEIQ
jgi:hypothetical protein